MIVYSMLYLLPNLNLYIFSSTALSRSSTFCAIFTALKQLRTNQSTDVFQLVNSFYTNNPGVTYNTVTYVLLHTNYNKLIV